MKTTEDTLSEILELAATHFQVASEKLNADDDFFSTLGIDSLKALELLTRVPSGQESISSSPTSAGPLASPVPREPMVSSAPVAARTC